MREKILELLEEKKYPAIAALVKDMNPAEAKLAKFCPECGSKLEHEGGCVTCRNCGYSKCG